MLKIENNISLKKYNSWEVGGNAEYFCLPQNLEEIIAAEDYALKNKVKITIIGSGSNVLIPDKGIDGLVICTKKFKSIKTEELSNRLVVNCDSGLPKFQLMKAFLKHNLPPAIFLSGLPGDVGGGIVMNAGISEGLSPKEFVEICDRVDVLRNGKIISFQKEELQWTYRHCDGWQPGIIVTAQFSWDINDKQQDIKKKSVEFSKSRWLRQPLDKPTCGSTFVNPKENSAGFYIEQAGLKGYSIGGAMVSKKHANFIENTGKASAQDIKKLILHIQKTVKEKFAVELKTEVKFL